MVTLENARFRSAQARWVLGVGVALSLASACGRSSSRARNHSPDGEGGTTVSSGGTSSGGAGASTADAGEPSSDRGGQAGETAGGAGAGVSGEPGLGGGSSVGGASAGAAGGLTAGTSAGGASGSGGAGGAAGMPGMPVLPLPEGCEVRGRTEDEESCSIGVFCEGVPNLANCRRLSSDDWQCSCELANNDRTYEIAGAPGLQACAVAAGLCFEDELVLGSEVCTEGGESNDDACDLDLTCGKPIDIGFAPGVTASLMDYGHGACWRTGTAQPFECTCEHGGVTREFGILAEDGSLACRPLIEFCRQDIEPIFDEPTVCIERDPSSSAEVCDLHSTCATPMKLTDEVSLAELEPRYANCVATSSGSRCYCSDQTETFGFDVEAPPSATTCASSIANCAEDVSISPLGDASCHATSQLAGTDFCEADLDCLQPASVDDRAIVARGRLLVHCAQSTVDQSWWCSCASNQDSTIFEYGVTASSAWEVCTQAPAGCLERMPVFLGPYGEFMPPPYPLSEP
jgi:hypothetical protein